MERPSGPGLRDRSGVLFCNADGARPPGGVPDRALAGRRCRPRAIRTRLTGRARRGRPMQHSYDQLDRAGGFSRVRILEPVAHRDFRLLWSGMCVSLVGDGLFLVALVWQVYSLSNAPTALATVMIAMTVPPTRCLLIGGAVRDRFDRRRVRLDRKSTR